MCGFSHFVWAAPVGTLLGKFHLPYGSIFGTPSAGYSGSPVTGEAPSPSGSEGFSPSPAPQVPSGFDGFSPSPVPDSPASVPEEFSIPSPASGVFSSPPLPSVGSESGAVSSGKMFRYGRSSVKISLAIAVAKALLCFSLATLASSITM